MLASGAGTNLRALLEACDRPGYPAAVVAVLSNRQLAGALAIAARHGVEAAFMPLQAFGGDAAARDRAMRDRLREARVELVVCAGYNRLLSPDFMSAFPNAILNVHPSLLPAFGGGMRGVEDALEYGVKVAGCTVQLLEPGEPDGGPIILQAPVPVLEDDDLDTLRRRVHEQEWLLLPEAVALWSQGRLQREGRRVRILPPVRSGTAGVRVTAVQTV
ncbi:MAG: phosphoribosylglycinamide formyltransferase [Candidatus Dormibacteria bacterium]